MNRSFISSHELACAADCVKADLAAVGLWHETRLPRVEILHCLLPQFPLSAMAFFVHSAHPLARWMGYEPGHIYFPAFTLMRRNARDVLRHEYGHALAHHHPALIQRGGAFEAAFGGKYVRDTASPYTERRDCVSAYAATLPCEDFAETFQRYVRRGGRPLRNMRPNLRRKWRFIDHLRERLGACRTELVSLG